MYLGAAQYLEVIAGDEMLLQGQIRYIRSCKLGHLVAPRANVTAYSSIHPLRNRARLLSLGRFGAVAGTGTCFAIVAACNHTRWHMFCCTRIADKTLHKVR